MTTAPAGWTSFPQCVPMPCTLDTLGSEGRCDFQSSEPPCRMGIITPHFPEEENEVQRHSVICFKLSQLVSESESPVLCITSAFV